MRQQPQPKSGNILRCPLAHFYSAVDIKLLLGLDTSRMSPTDTRRVKAIMASLGWEEGTHRLHDLGRGEKRQRKGFARGNADERKREYLAQRLNSGVVVLNRASAQSEGDPPF